MEVKWYGTASVGFEHNGTRILFDPFIRMNKRIRPNITAEDFTEADAIFATHGHFDHILSFPEIEAKANIPIYATRTPVATLKALDIPEERLHTIKPGDSVKIGDFTVTVYQAKHVTFDLKYIASVFPHCFVTFPKFFYLTYLNKIYPENGENLGYEVECEGKRVFIMGSFGTVPHEHYPKDCDMFILPFGGCSGLHKISAPFIADMLPKKVMITHYDNSFPPATRRVDAEGLGADIKNDHPEIEIIVPEEFKAYTV